MQEWRREIDFLLLAGGNLDICRHCETVSKRDVLLKSASGVLTPHLNGIVHPELKILIG